MHTHRGYCVWWYPDVSQTCGVRAQNYVQKFYPIKEICPYQRWPQVCLKLWGRNGNIKVERLFFVPIIISGQGKMVCWLVGGKCVKKELSQINNRHFQTSNWTNKTTSQSIKTIPDVSDRASESSRCSNLCICVWKLNLLVNVVMIMRRKARKIQIWIAIKYSTDDMYVFSYSSCLYPVHCTINILIRILSICLSFPLHQHHQDFNSLYLSVFVSFRMLLRLCVITSSSSTHTLQFFCICLHFLFIFPVVVSIIITIDIVIWTNCVSYIFFIPIIIVTFRMCVVIVVESSWNLAKPSSPSTSFKYFCICLAFSYFLLSLRSFWYHPRFLFRCI